jgi:hypothetical protein
MDVQRTSHDARIVPQLGRDNRTSGVQIFFELIEALTDATTKDDEIRTEEQTDMF